MLLDQITQFHIREKGNYLWGVINYMFVNEFMLNMNLNANVIRSNNTISYF